MTDELLKYTFFPYVRYGLAARLTKYPRVQGRLTVNARVKLKDRAQGAEVPISFYGPGDVRGIDQRIVVRDEPRHQSMRFEPEYLPFVEFDPPDFPWLFTSSGAAANQLRPWLCLVVVPKDKAKLTDAQPLPVLECPLDELPDLANSWAWAHAHLTWSVTEDPPPPGKAYKEMNDAPERTVSRLLSFRKLKPDQHYVACVVPSFQVGMQAGLDDEVTYATEADGAAYLIPAWTPPDPSKSEEPKKRVRLPVYHHWEFATGPQEDFEDLVQKLVPVPLEDLKKSSIGQVQIDLSKPGWGMASETSSDQDQGTLYGVLSTEPDTDWTWKRADELRTILNHTAAGAVPILTPPVYGQGYRPPPGAVPELNNPPNWFSDVNLDPRWRVAAGLGTHVVQTMQDELVGAAWDYAAQVAETNRALQNAQIRRDTGQVFQKRMEGLDDDAFLRITGPLQASLNVPADASGGDTMTVRRLVQASTVPEAIFSPSFRRLTRPRGPLARVTNGSTRTPREPLVRRLALENRALVSPLKELPSARKVGMVGQSLDGALAQYRANLPPVEYKIVPSGTPDGSGDESDVKKRFNQAVVDLVNRLTPPVHRILPVPPRFLVPALVRANMADAAAPGLAVVAQARRQLTVPDTTWYRQDPLATLKLSPTFSFPMYRQLRALFPDMFLPGVGQLPPNAVTVLKANSRFVEAFMLGLNHELTRELLWRDFPVEKGATYFRQFWDPLRKPGEDTADIKPIADWLPESRLGDHMTTEGRKDDLVLLVRGELLRRYPNAIIYAVPAIKPLKTPENPNPPPIDFDRRSEARLYPIFNGLIPPDITFFGFNLNRDEAVKDLGYFFVIQEHPTEPRFALQTGGSPGEDASQYIDETKLGTDSASIAKALLQGLHGLAVHACYWLCDPEQKKEN